MFLFMFFFSSRRRHTRSKRDWSSDVCSSDLSSSSLSFLSSPLTYQLEHPRDYPLNDARYASFCSITCFGSSAYKGSNKSSTVGGGNTSICSTASSTSAWHAS